MNNSIKKLFDPSDQLDPKSVEFLTNALASSTQQGFDYLKFKSSVQASKDLGLSDDMAIKTAFATASSIGLTKDKLIHSIELYSKVLSQEKQQFEAAMKNQMEKRVAARMDETEYLKSKILEYKDKIKELESNIASYESKVNSADSEIEQEKSKINSTQQRFVDAHHGFAETIAADLKLFKEIL